MSIDRHLVFWITALLVFVLLLWLLSEVLLPFVAGLALAYLQVPLADRLQRHGMNRTLAALVIVGVVVLILIAFALVFAPILAAQASALVTVVPGYISKLQMLLADETPLWLSQLVSGSDANKTVTRAGRSGSGLRDGIHAFPVVRRQSAGIVRVAARRHAGCHFLSHPRLARDDQDA